MKMSNKQVIAIFMLGVALLLGAFWAGLYVVKQDTTATGGQGVAANQNSQGGQGGKLASSNANMLSGEQSPSDGARYAVLVAAFGTQDKAKQLESELRKKYLSAHVQIENGLYRVRIGPYDKRDADKVAGELSNERKGIMILPWTQN
jgi:cell division septation protein DedD